MKHKKYGSTRRATALKLLAGIALLLAFVSMTNMLGLLPVNALRQLEQTTGTGHTRVVCGYHDREAGVWIHLGENDRALLLSAADLNVTGWGYIGGCPQALSGGTAANYYIIHNSKNLFLTYYVFGKVPGGCAGVEAVLRNAAEAFPDLAMETLALRTVGGDGYFLCRAAVAYDGNMENYPHYNPTVKALDAAGKVALDETLGDPAVFTSTG